MIQTIDTLLLKNTYFKNLSVADRLAIYNIALKRIAELRNYFYTNQSSTPNFTINISDVLSSMDSIDDILSDDLQPLSQQERLLIYNMVQSRIGSLRNLQNHHYYLVSNTRGQLRKSTILSLSILKSIRTLIEIIQQKILILPIKNSIATFVEVIQQKVLSLPLTYSIISSLQQNRILRFPISATIQMISVFQTKVKSLVLPIQSMINIIASGTTSISYRVLPIANSILTIFAGVTIQQKNLVLPLTKSISTLASYQHIKEKSLTMPLTHSINTI